MFRKIPGPTEIHRQRHRGRRLRRRQRHRPHAAAHPRARGRQVEGRGLKKGAGFLGIGPANSKSWADR